MSVTASVLTAPGINCHNETAYALEVAGAEAKISHINEIIENPKILDNSNILVLSGGFSHGDHIAAGRILGLQLRRELAEPLTRFIQAGKIIVGICNGFQVLVESGILPYGVIDGTDRRSLALTTNAQGGFHCDWKELTIPDSQCRFIRPEMFALAITLQVAHGEGNLKARNPSIPKYLLANGQVVLQYCDANGQPTEAYPSNPNGSPFGITGVCNPDGNVVGLMPHPERSVDENRPHYPYGKIIFEQMVKQAKEL